MLQIGSVHCRRTGKRDSRQRLRSWIIRLREDWDVKRSINRTLTTHAGSLPRPEDLMVLYREDAPDLKLLPRLQSAITDVVRRQAEIGIDIVNDGEFGKAMRRAVDFAAWWSYVYDRLAGFEIRKENTAKGRAVYTIGSKERKEFAEFYAEDGGMGGPSPSPIFGLICTGPVKYIGQQAVRRDIDLLTSATRGVAGRRGIHYSGIAGDAADPAKRAL